MRTVTHSDGLSESPHVSPLCAAKENPRRDFSGRCAPRGAKPNAVAAIAKRCLRPIPRMIADLRYLAQTAIDRRTGLCCWDCDMECDGTGAFRFSRATVLGSQIDSAS